MKRMIFLAMIALMTLNLAACGEDAFQGSKREVFNQVRAIEDEELRGCVMYSTNLMSLRDTGSATASTNQKHLYLVGKTPKDVLYEGLLVLKRMKKEGGIYGEAAEEWIPKFKKYL